MIIRIKPKIQHIIDLIVSKNWLQATILLAEVNQKIEDLVDITSDDEQLIELSKYQLLLQHLQNKIKNEQH